MPNRLTATKQKQKSSGGTKSVCLYFKKEQTKNNTVLLL